MQTMFFITKIIYEKLENNIEILLLDEKIKLLDTLGKKT